MVKIVLIKLITLIIEFGLTPNNLVGGVYLWDNYLLSFGVVFLLM